MDNGFLSCADPEKLQQICDSLGPEDIDRLFRKWLKRLPLPLRPEDRAAGYDWSLSIWQMEVSLTQIFDRPLRGREFFEEIIRDNLDLGRPDRVQLIFDRAAGASSRGGRERWPWCVRRPSGPCRSGYRTCKPVSGARPRSPTRERSAG